MTWSYTNPTTHQVTGMVYSRTDVAGNTTTNTYDSLNQLTSASTKTGAGTTLHSYSYSYDPAGNLLSKTQDSATTPMTYNAANELTQAGTKTLSYDLNGSRIGDSTGASYTYNAAGQMASLTPAGGTAMSMTYAGPGQSQRVAAGSKTYQYDQTGMKQFYNGATTSQLTMTPDGTPVGYHTGGSTYLYLVNPDDGSIAGIYTADGLSLKNVVIYTPTGDVIDGSQLDPGNAMGWQGLDNSDGSTDNGGGCFDDPTTASDISCDDSSGDSYSYQSLDPNRKRMPGPATWVALAAKCVLGIGFTDTAEPPCIGYDIVVDANTVGWKPGKTTIETWVWRDKELVFHNKHTCGNGRTVNHPGLDGDFRGWI